MNITVNHIAESTALVVSIINLKYIRTGKLKSLPVFLSCILLVELAGNFLRTNGIPNVPLYNITIPLEYGYYLFLFWLHGEKLTKRVAMASGIILISISVLFHIIKPLYIFHSQVLLTGQITTILCACTSITDIFNNPDEDSLFKKYFFWIIAGLLLFSLGEICYAAFYPLIHKKQWDKFDTLFKLINNSLLILLYLSYCIAILIIRKNYHSKNARRF